MRSSRFLINLRDSYIWIGLLLICILLLIHCPAQAQRQNVAVLEFEGDKSLKGTASAMSALFQNHLLKSGKVNVVNRKDIVKILKEQELQLSGATDTKQAVKVGKLLNVQYLFTGTVSKLKNKYVMVVNITDVESAKAKSSHKEITDDYDGLISAVKKIAYQFTGVWVDNKRKKVSVHVKKDIDPDTKLKMSTSVKEGAVLDAGDKISIDVTYDINNFDKNKDNTLWLGIKPDKYWGLSFDDSKYRFYPITKKSGKLSFEIKLTKTNFRLYERRWKINKKGEYEIMVRLQHRPHPGAQGTTFAIASKKFRRR